MSTDVTMKTRPRLIGFLCENGAYVFYDISNPARRRRLPGNFLGLPITGICQVRTREVLKAFLSGAEGVLVAGCEACQRQQDQAQIERRFSEIQQTLVRLGIDRRRLRVEWISATEERKFLSVVNAMMENLQGLPVLKLPAGHGKNLVYCG
ncbi:MAG: hydrogenase iron-sulfur subunit [candidate division KSB1 bacterium]|nr:hydrogenase iron-sulfur subunit [candidate division KSB1 bacterium]